MTQNEMDYLLRRFGQAFLAAGNALMAAAPAFDVGGNAATPKDPGSTPVVDPAFPVVEEPIDPALVDVQPGPAMGEVGVIANRCPLRSEPTKSIDVDLGKLLEGERVPLDAISEDKKWYRVDVRNFAGVHSVPDDAVYAWGEASNFEIIKLN